MYKCRLKPTNKYIGSEVRSCKYSRRNLNIYYVFRIPRYRQLCIWNNAGVELVALLYIRGNGRSIDLLNPELVHPGVTVPADLEVYILVNEFAYVFRYCLT